MRKFFIIIILSILSFSINSQIAAWDFNGFGSTSLPTFAATTFNANLISSSGANNITRGSSAAWSTGNNSFRTQGFQNNGIATSNNDYFQITLQAATGYLLSLTSIDANLAGTATFAASPGVSSQFAYSLDGSNFTLISSAQLIVGSPQSITPIDLTGISALQSVPNGTIVTLRFYASGQTSTGGWGFISSIAGTNGLAIGGTLSAVMPVEFYSFNVVKNSNLTYVEFSTASETNNSHFNIERSADARNFESIGEIKGAGNSSKEISYTFTDEKPLPGINYYRIKQTDYDGQFSYSEIRSVRHKGLSNVSVTPRTTEGRLDITTELEDYTIAIYNAAGQEVKRMIGMSLDQSISIETLNAGVYFVKINSRSESETVRIVKI